MGFGIKKEAGSNTTPSDIVNFDKLTPTTAGVVFDPNTPATEDILYVSSVDASTWIWNGTAYITYSPPATTEWYLNNTTIDAGSNKTAAIIRTGPVYLEVNETSQGFRVNNMKNSGASNGISVYRTAGTTGGYGLQILKGSTNQLRVNHNGSLLINDAYTLPSTDGLATQSLVTNGSGTVTWGASAGGLTYFTEAQSTASPNATVNVDSLTAIASTTNADFAIVSKGTGALTRHIPDGTATGGNKRGAGAVDLSTIREVEAQVASGAYSFIGGGAYNRAQGAYSIAMGTRSAAWTESAVAIGSSATANGAGVAVAIGNSVTASGENSFANGLTSTASALCSIAMGRTALSSNTYSVALGAFTIANGVSSVAINNGAHTFGITGRIVFSSTQLGVMGDAQSSKLILRKPTTNNTPTVLSSDSGATSAINQLTLQNNNVFRVKGSITGKQSGSTNVGVWDIDCVIVRGANAASTVIAGTPTVSLVVNTGGFGNPTLTANTTLGCLTVTVIGVAATNIQWTCAIDTTEVIYA